MRPSFRAVLELSKEEVLLPTAGGSVTWWDNVGEQPGSN